MNIKKGSGIKKDQIISEYLTGDQSYRELSSKYGVNARTIQTWVRAVRKHGTHAGEAVSNAESPEIRSLKKQLQQAELKNDLLEEMLRLAEEQTGIALRKKFGSEQ